MLCCTGAILQKFLKTFRVMYILGYIPRDNRLYLGDKELNVVSYSLLLSVLEYQTAVMRRDFETADKVLPTVPREQRTRVAHFLEKQDFKSQALAVTMDMDHKFELAMQLKDIKIAYQVAKTIESEEKWKQLSELATSKCEFKLAAECLHNAQDYGGLLLLATCTGDETMVENIAQSSDESNKSNISFVSNLLLGRVEECIDILVKTGRVPEAAFFARTYMPSKMAQIVSLWKENLGKFDKKKSEALADPEKYENLFVGLKEAYYGEKFVKKTEKKYLASEYPNVMVPCERNIMSELQQALEDGLVSIDEETKDVKVTMVTKEPSPVSENMQNDEESRETKPRSDTDVSLDLDMDNVNYDDITDIDFNIDDDILTD
ncbi:coatomer subunit beta'-like [Saccoglossus kowalevskii]|uniref:Coatomer subunit beta'-like n=1 Tax=Saccoglossus kowalevskii TaxID=10224 RepID=A0ABM0M0D6_SACKO|nr:PREDICTED: coatomer subunit beta'-like [Saccoglossus kowalevskii]